MILRGRVESTRCPETGLRPSRHKVIKPTQVDLATDVASNGLDMLRAHAIAVAHHVVRGWLIEDILKLFDRHAFDVDPVDKGVVIFDEPLEDPAMPCSGHAAILGSIYGTEEPAKYWIARTMPPGLLTSPSLLRRCSSGARAIR